MKRFETVSNSLLISHAEKLCNTIWNYLTLTETIWNYLGFFEGKVASSQKRFETVCVIPLSRFQSSSNKMKKHTSNDE